MKKIKQILIVLFLFLSILPIDKIAANTNESFIATTQDKILKSSHEVLPEGVDVDKYIGDQWDREDAVYYGESFFVPYVITVENNSQEDIEKIFIQDDLKEVEEYILEESLDHELSYSGYYLGSVLQSDGETDLEFTSTVRELKEGIYVDLDAGSSITFNFKLELKQDLLKEDFDVIKNTVTVNNIQYSHELPVLHPEITVDKQSIAYLGETPYEEIPDYDGDEEPIEEEEEDEIFYWFERTFEEQVYSNIVPSSTSEESDLEILEKAKAGSKIRYAIVVDNVGQTRANNYKISDISLDEIVPQYAQYIDDEVSIYSSFNDEHEFILSDNPLLEGYTIYSKLSIENLKEGMELTVLPKERVIVVFDLLLNAELPEDLEFIENTVVYQGGKVVEKTPIEPQESEKPETPEDGEKPETPEDGEKPETPKDGEKPEIPEDGEKPETPEDGEKPETPEDGEKPETPEDGEKPEIPDEGEKPETPEDGEKPETPEDGEKPETPEDGEKPETPEDGEKPETPEDGEKPETPEEGEKPETPEDGEKPETPEDGEKPETPEDGEKPETPEDGEKPETPEDGEKPETPEDGEKPETPKDGEKPETPEDGEKPETPEDGEKPEIPEDGEKPETREDGEKPETPEDGEKPETSGNDEKIETLPSTGMSSVSDLSVRIILLGLIMILIDRTRE